MAAWRLEAAWENAAGGTSFPQYADATTVGSGFTSEMCRVTASCSRQFVVLPYAAPWNDVSFCVVSVHLNRMAKVQCWWW